jgi:phosphoglycolate phosphatase-like HAD superfamily hydrolase
MDALLFGSIGTLVETSELQRESFNLAFKQFGLDWYWNTATYCKLITEPGEKKRIKQYSDNKLQDLEINEIHKLKEEFFAKVIVEKLYLRPSVKDIIGCASSKTLNLDS